MMIEIEVIQNVEILPQTFVAEYMREFRLYSGILYQYYLDLYYNNPSSPASSVLKRGAFIELTESEYIRLSKVSEDVIRQFINDNIARIESVQ